MTSDFPAPTPLYLGPAAHTSEGDNKPIKRIVLHSTVSECAPGMAWRIAAWFKNPDSRGSAHYVVDPAEVIQVVFDGVIAWHAPPNQNSIGIELCDMPDKESAARWCDANHQKMLELAAVLVAQLCLAYDVRPWYVGVLGLRLGRGGVTTHNDVSRAFGQSDHWDLGAWPRRQFMQRVRFHYDRIKKGAKP